MNLEQVSDLLKNGGVSNELVDELIETYSEAKRRFAAGDHRPHQVEGGRFTEAVFRILQEMTTRSYTPLDRSLPSVDDLMVTLTNVPRASASDAVRLHIPRTLRLIYDIRNKRDAAHLGPVDAGLQDSTLIVHGMDWVLAELVREHDSSISPEEAQRIIEGLVARELPVIQMIDGYPLVLRDLQASDHMLVLLYSREPTRTAFDELSRWARPPMRTNLRRTLDRLEQRNLVHRDAAGTYRITRLGQREVEQRRLLAEP